MLMMKAFWSYNYSRNKKKTWILEFYVLLTIRRISLGFIAYTVYLLVTCTSFLRGYLMYFNVKQGVNQAATDTAFPPQTETG